MSTIEILRNLKSLVGEVEFNKAVTALSATALSASGPNVVVDAAPTKKPRKSDPVKSAKRSSDMAALQNYIGTIRKEMPEDTPYKQVQVEAGKRWKTLTVAEKEKFATAPPAPPAAADNKVCQVTVPEPKEPKQSVTVKKSKKAAEPPWDMVD